MHNVNPTLVQHNEFLFVRNVIGSDVIIAAAFLQELYDRPSPLNTCIDSVSGVIEAGEMFRFGANKFNLCLNHSAQNLAVRLGMECGVIWDANGVTDITIFTADGKEAARLDVHAHQRANIRDNRIDLIRGGFPRLASLLSIFGDLVLSGQSGNHGYRYLIETMPSFNVDEYCASELERTKRSPFLRDLDRLLHKRQGHLQMDPGLQKMWQLITMLLEMEHSFVIDDRDNLIRLTIRMQDDTHTVAMPLGLLVPFSEERLVNRELAILRNAMANKPLL